MGYHVQVVGINEKFGPYINTVQVGQSVETSVIQSEYTKYSVQRQEIEGFLSFIIPIKHTSFALEIQYLWHILGNIDDTCSNCIF